MRSSGTAYNHLSKDGTPEPVYFTRLPEIKNGNPNTPVSLQKLKDFGDYLRTNVDAVVFLGVGGSYLGNKVLFDIGAGPSWNSMGENAATAIRAFISRAITLMQASAKKL